MKKSAVYDVAVVGAGSAGIAAAKTLQSLGLSFVVLEGSHRIGGRGYTETMNDGVQFDLGCHWLHAASINPYREIADRYGFTYGKGTFTRHLFWNGAWLDKAGDEACERYLRQSAVDLETAGRQATDCSVYEAVDQDSPWATVLDHWVTLNTSANSDQVSVRDMLDFEGPDEDWPIREGFGRLIELFGSDVPVSLNTRVERIDWGTGAVTVHTNRGAVAARTVLLTVSTGVLGAGDIEFRPALPDWKQTAIQDLPLGLHNRICVQFDRNVFGDEHPPGVNYYDGVSEMMTFRIRPFDQNVADGVTGGRFAWWLEKAGVQASLDYATERLAHVFGNDLRKHIVRHNVTAWGGDPWVKGAYSARKPGADDPRGRLSQGLEERVFFAGEATSSDAFCTAHGALQTGVRAANQIAAALGTTGRN